VVHGTALHHHAPEDGRTSMRQHQIEANNSVKKTLIYLIQTGIVCHPLDALRPGAAGATDGSRAARISGAGHLPKRFGSPPL
jgi:hypothetical protein